MFILFQKHGLTLRSYVHSETQDGKSSIDAHFAVCMRHVLAYVNMGMNVTSPLKLYKVLSVNGGLLNTVPILFELDCVKIEEYISQYSNALKFFSNIKRCNEVEFGATVISIYKYSGLTPILIDMSDPVNIYWQTI